MHFVIPQSLLAPAITTVSKAIASRSTHPILGNIKIEADAEEQKITLTGFDLNIAIIMPLTAQVVTSGAITLPAKMLGDIVSRLPDEDITLIQGEIAVNLHCGNGRYQLNGLPIEEFPELPTIDAAKSFTMPIAAIKNGLAATLIAVSQDVTKRILTAVHIESNADSLEFASTDGHRLSVYQNSIEDGQEFSVNIPSNAMRVLMNMAGTQDLPVSMQCDEANAIFALPQGTLITRLLDGTYPNYLRLLPSTFERNVTVDRRLLMAALERIAVLSDQNNNIVKLTISNEAQKIALSVESPDVATGRESLPIQFNGEDLEIDFNVRYLKDGLSTISTTEIQLKLNTATSPAVLVPIGAVKQEYLLMPVQIRN